MLGCSANNIYRLIAGGELPTINIAPSGSRRTKTRIRREDLRTYIDGRTQGPVVARLHKFYPTSLIVGCMTQAEAEELDQAEVLATEDREQMNWLNGIAAEPGDNICTSSYDEELDQAEVLATEDREQMNWLNRIAAEPGYCACTTTCYSGFTVKHDVGECDCRCRSCGEHRLRCRPDDYRIGRPPLGLARPGGRDEPETWLALRDVTVAIKARREDCPPV
jgi:hypothetical protein